MRAGASLGWRIATAVAFGATAALAVALSHAAPTGAALASAKGPDGQHPAASTRPAPAAAPCAPGGLRILLGPGVRVSAVTTRYPLDFTNVSHVPCVLAGYPRVSAYRGDDVQVGAAAGLDPSAAAGRVVLAPGQTAHATLEVTVPGARCGPVRATGLRVIAPGQAVPRYVRRPLAACTAGPARGQDYLRVGAIQSGAGVPAGTAAPGGAD
jgi:hypothetical protein